MPSFSASAPGKIILFGEHAVVYGQPAIAVPVKQVRTKATVTPNIRGTSGEMRILAPNIGLDSSLDDVSPGNPIGEVVNKVAATLEIDHIPSCTLKITSTIPVASGLGSGAAVSVAVIRALAGFLGKPLPNEKVSALAYEIEKIHHGTPSGIDNTVVTYAQPVFFIKGQPVEVFSVTKPFSLVIGDTGIPAPTKKSVGDVQMAWRSNPTRYERLFAACGSIAKTGRQAIESGHPEWLGPLMNENHELLQQMDVSSPELDHLVNIAKEAGASGAKLSGGGRGGNMIAFVEIEQAEIVVNALQTAGAKHTILTEVGT